jgi:hypothetical protein
MVAYLFWTSTCPLVLGLGEHVMKSVDFGWELNSVHNNGADLFVKILNPITVVGIEMDVAYMATSAPGGSFAEVLCNAVILPAHPTFTPGDQAYFNGVPSADFGGSQFCVPNPAVNCHGGMGTAGALCSVILKTWAPAATNRNVVVTGLSIPAPAGSFFLCHMDHAGYPGDIEMQGVLFYQ